jgi:hypothetical protein
MNAKAMRIDSVKTINRGVNAKARTRKRSPHRLSFSTPSVDEFRDGGMTAPPSSHISRGGEA